MTEPGWWCSGCGMVVSASDGSRLGRRCPACGGILVPAEPVGEVVLPAHNAADASAIQQFFSALPLPLSLELFGSAGRRGLWMRGASERLQTAAALLESTWPRASLRVLPADPSAALRADPGAQTRAYRLAAPAYLPLRTWTTFRYGDPLEGLFAALLPLRGREQIWLQLALQPLETPGWLPWVQRRLKAEAQRGYTVTPNPAPGAQPWVAGEAVAPVNVLRGMLQIGVIVVALVVIALGLAGWWLAAGLLAVALIAGGGRLWQRVERDDQAWEGADLRLVRQKVVEGGPLFAVTLRVAARAEGPLQAVRLLERVERALAQYHLAGGNGLEADPVGSALLELNAAELAGLWHPPLVEGKIAPGAAAVGGLERRAPDPEAVAGFHRIGRGDGAGGLDTVVSISARALRGNLFLIGKPGMGKTTLMEQLALAALRHPDHPAVVLVDPHGDMAERMTGIIDPADAPRLRLLDLGDEEYTLTVNPLDIHTQGGTPETIAQLIVDVGRQLWSEFWGPRMQIPLNRAVQLLAAANTLRAPDDGYGLSLLAGLVGARHAVRRAFLDAALDERVEFAEIRRYFTSEFPALSPVMREQIIQPVLSKAIRFRDAPMLPLFSCPRTLLDLGQVIRERQALVINTRLARFGPELSDFAGSLLLNLLLRALARQGELRPEGRAPVLVLVDEFQTFTGVPWMEWEQQIRKWGGGVVLGTQSLDSLRAGQGPELPGIITSGSGSLFVFGVNGVDAAYLAEHELSQRAGGPTPETLTALPPYHAYARLVGADGAPGRPFSLVTDPPRPFDAQLSEQARARRADYALPYHEALALARAKLTDFDRLQDAAPLTSRGVEAGGTRTAARVADILLQEAAGEPPGPAVRPEAGTAAGLLDEDSPLAEEIASELGALFPAEEDPPLDGDSLAGTEPGGEPE